MPGDVDQVLAAAKERMPTTGVHVPLVVVVTGAQHHPIEVSEGAWSADPAIALFLAGRSFAHREQIAHTAITAIFLVQEVWTLHPHPGEPAPEVPLEQHPDRREALSVWELRVEEQQLRQTGYLAEILRQGGTIDLGPTRTMREFESQSLPSFLAGVGSAQWSDREFLQRLRTRDFGEL